MPLAAKHGGAKSSGATRLDHRWVASLLIAARANAMDSNANDFAETDADILTFDIRRGARASCERRTEGLHNALLH